MQGDILQQLTPKTKRAKFLPKPENVGMVQNACHSGDSSGPLDGSGVLQRLLPAAERRNFIAWRRKPQGNPSCRPRRRPHGP